MTAIGDQVPPQPAPVRSYDPDGSGAYSAKKKFEDIGSYVAIQGGAGFMTGFDGRGVEDEYVRGDSTVMPSAGIKFGWRIPSTGEDPINYRIEFEGYWFGGSRNAGDYILEQNAAFLGLNLITDFHLLEWPIIPYIGFGAGGVLDWSTVSGPGVAEGGDDMEVRFAIQPIAGVQIPISGAWFALAEYKWLWMHNASYDGLWTADTGNHFVHLGLGLGF